MEAFGDGAISASPLAIASVSATVDTGVFKQPILVPGARQITATPLPASTDAGLKADDARGRHHRDGGRARVRARRLRQRPAPPISTGRSSPTAGSPPSTRVRTSRSQPWSSMRVTAPSTPPPRGPADLSEPVLDRDTVGPDQCSFQKRKGSRFSCASGIGWALMDLVAACRVFIHVGERAASPSAPPPRGCLSRWRAGALPRWRSTSARVCSTGRSAGPR